ncbi:response regulator transcription factor [Cohnella candidum]|uniref:Response regulator n=1 Tax=Cohnella candidum TaxID=2674991 RepID=A0A3G3JWW9_9BACL|nr:helix-turn-helix domain-containing protein [Cohnella candidum]AYQ72351.1 response regulator [Cohnella candidum]
MNKVLVVDDEKLVRQGIITTFPWEKHGFQVTCDAGSGEKALELLEREEIDLLVTDLAMNGMSGLELIKRVKESRRDLPVVILTCHDNFRYIQEAMRLGVLDYIVKTEIEDEIVDETLTRIAGKLAEERSPYEPAKSGADSKRQTSDGLLLCGPSRSSRPAELLWKDEWEGWVGRMTEIDAATWLLRVTPAEADRLTAKFAAMPETGGWLCIHVTGIGEANEAEAAAKLKQYRKRVLFYASGGRLQTRGWSDVAAVTNPSDEVAVSAAALRADWLSADWVYDDSDFERLLATTAGSGMEAEELRNMLYPVALEWERLLDNGTLNEFHGLAGSGLFWKEWESGLRSFRQSIRQTVGRNATRQTSEAVFRAIELMREAIDSESGEAEIARAVGMSRGHFSKSFKKVTGKSYGEYLRLIKLERAKEMILRTDEPITRVAELCGFSDYRHFSRVFRDYTGKLPTEYRKAGALD